MIQLLHDFLSSHFSQLSLIISLFVLSAVFLQVGNYEKRTRLALALTALMIGVSAFVGARILHVIIEDRSLLQTPKLIFTQFDGMTFNGSLIFGGVALLLSGALFSPRVKSALFDKVAIIAAFGYGLLRIGCFIDGCCWGKPHAGFLSVKYFDSGVMPWVGIPVYPVQLFDSLLGFGIGFILATLMFKKKWSGELLKCFFILYATGRFITEFFRGDSFRGDSIFLSLSVSQIASLLILLSVLLLHISTFARLRTSVYSFACLFLFTACLPQAPKPADLESVQITTHFEVNQLNNHGFIHHKNVIYLAADENIQFTYASTISRLYPNKNVRVEDLSYWLYFPDMQKLYDVVIRVPFEKVGYQSLLSAIEYAERLGEPYDIILFTHGMPNHISSGHGYFFGYQELSPLKGKLRNLDLVLMQGCFGRSLAPDWESAGAKHVVSFEGLNNNFFFAGIFLDALAGGLSANQAFSIAVDDEPNRIQKMPYKMLVGAQLRLRRSKGEVISFDSYVRTLSKPYLD